MASYVPVFKVGMCLFLHCPLNASAIFQALSILLFRRSVSQKCFEHWRFASKIDFLISSPLFLKLRCSMLPMLVSLITMLPFYVGLPDDSLLITTVGEF